MGTIVEQCIGCQKVAKQTAFAGDLEELMCVACHSPVSKWKNGKCNLATHISVTPIRGEDKKLNPLKASKRSMGK